VHEGRLDDKESALGCWREILRLEPADREAAGALERLAGELGRPQDLVVALHAQRMSERPGPRDRELAVRLARVKLEKQGDAGAALNLCEQVLDQDSSHAGALRVAEDCALSPGPEGARALAFLDRRLARRGEHDARVALRERRLAAAGAEEQPRLFAELRELCEERLRQPERAFLAGLKLFAAGADRERLCGRSWCGWPSRPTRSRSSARSSRPPRTSSRRATGWPRRCAVRGAAAREAGPARGGDPDVEGAARREPRRPRGAGAAGAAARGRRRARGLAEVCARKARLAPDPAERAALWRRPAPRGRPPERTRPRSRDYRAALALGSSAAALAGLDRVYGRPTATPSRPTSSPSCWP
jgi:hypothetical protein